MTRPPDPEATETWGYRRDPYTLLLIVLWALLLLAVTGNDTAFPVGLLVRVGFVIVAIRAARVLAYRAADDHDRKRDTPWDG